MSHPPPRRCTDKRHENRDGQVLAFASAPTNATAIAAASSGSPPPSAARQKPPQTQTPARCPPSPPISAPKNAAAGTPARSLPPPSASKNNAAIAVARYLPPPAHRPMLPQGRRPGPCPFPPAPHGQAPRQTRAPRPCPPPPAPTYATAIAAARPLSPTPQCCTDKRYRSGGGQVLVLHRNGTDKRRIRRGRQVLVPLPQRRTDNHRRTCGWGRQVHVPRPPEGRNYKRHRKRGGQVLVPPPPSVAPTNATASEAARS